MAIHGKATGIILGGYNLTSMLNQIATPQSLDTADVTHFGETAKKYIPGMADATVSMSGFFEGDAKATEEMLDVASDESDAILVTYGRGLAAGADCKFASVIRSSFEVSSPVGDVVSISGAAQADGGLLTGKVVAAALEASSASTSGSSVDNTVSSSNGGKAALLLTGNTRDGSVTVIVQHSDDNSVWVDLGTFAVVPTLTVASEVLELTETINRYVRVVVTLAGSTGSATTTVALSRG
jgi:hypothetical protein